MHSTTCRRDDLTVMETGLHWTDMEVASTEVRAGTSGALSTDSRVAGGGGEGVAPFRVLDDGAVGRGGVDPPCISEAGACSMW